jgi:multicomponent K+:H+ antiporter subunit E
MRRLLPQPLVSLMILALWIAIAPAPSLGQFVLGSAIALAIPWFTHPFWPDPPRLVRPVAAVLLFLRVMWDIVVANVEVARLVLGPSDRLHPQFIELPLEIDDPFVATLLASIITLTPGTLSVDIDRERRVLLVHALDVTDVPAAIDTIKRNYEAPLKEIFGC